MPSPRWKVGSGGGSSDGSVFLFVTSKSSKALKTVQTFQWTFHLGLGSGSS